MRKLKTPLFITLGNCKEDLEPGTRLAWQKQLHEDVHADVFRLVKKFLYTIRLEVDEDLPFETLLKTLEYSHQNVRLPKLTELIANKVCNQVSWYSLNVSMAHLCSAHRVKKSMDDIDEMKKTTKEHLLNSLIEEAGAEIKSEYEKLYEEFMLEVNGKEEKTEIQRYQFFEQIDDFNQT